MKKLLLLSFVCASLNSMDSQSNQVQPWSLSVAAAIAKLEAKDAAKMDLLYNSAEQAEKEVGEKVVVDMPDRLVNKKAKSNLQKRLKVAGKLLRDDVGFEKDPISRINTWAMAIMHNQKMSEVDKRAFLLALAYKAKAIDEKRKRLAVDEVDDEDLAVIELNEGEEAEDPKQRSWTSRLTFGLFGN